jgi:thioesterase domain-containing protein/acyl carrier protein
MIETTPATEVINEVRPVEDGTQVIDEIRSSHDLYGRSNLTRLQILYWVGQSLRRGEPVFNTIYAYEVKGAVEREAFERAFEGMVMESDALRMVIEEDEGVPQQRDIGRVPVGVEYVDLSGAGEVEGAYGAWLGERKGRVLALGESAYDTALVKLGAERYVWYLNVHHILVDASSFVQVYRRVAGRYKREVSGEVGGGEKWPQYEEYLAYERRYRGSGQYKRAEGYWAKKMMPGPEELKVWGKAPEKRGTRVKRESVGLGVERSERLRAAARREGVYTVSEELSLYNIFGGMLYVELAGISGNRRLGVVTPVHNRFTEGFRNMVGLLLEFCPLQVEVGEGDTLEGVVRKVRKETRETMGYYQYGSGMALQSQAYDVMFNTYSVPKLELGGAEVEAERVHPGHGSESLGVHVTDVERLGEFVVHFDFHEDVFEEGRRRQVIEGYVRLLDAYLDDPEQSVVGFISQESREPEIVREPQIESGKFLEFDLPGQVPPKDLLEFKILQVWQDVLGTQAIGVNDNFFEAGGNSWLAVRLFVEIEKATGSYLPMNTLLQAATVADLAKVIRQEMGGEIWSTVISIHPGKGLTPIYFAPGAAENGLAVARVARYFNPDQPVYMFQIPLGVEQQDQLTRIEDMANHYVTALRNHQPQGPYILGGYSAGGLVALEVAQQLRQQGHEVALLAILDVPAQSPNYAIVQRFTHWVSELLNLGDMKERTLFLSWRDTLFRLDYFLRKGFTDWVREWIARVQRFINRSGEERNALMKKKVNGFRGQSVSEGPIIGSEAKAQTEAEGDLAWKDYDRHMREHFDTVNEAVKCYIPKPYPGRIVLFRSSVGYRRAEMRIADSEMGWGRIAEGGLEMFVIPGNHLQIVREPNVRQLGETLKTYLEQVQEILSSQAGNKSA